MAGGGAGEAFCFDSLKGKLGEHSGQLRQETAEAKAERIMGGELRRLGWQKADLRSRPKSDRRIGDRGARAARNNTLDQTDRGAGELGHIQKRQCPAAFGDEGA